MKKLATISVISLILLTGAARSIDLGFLSVNDTINIPLICLDTLGRAAAPDSVHVMTWYHGQGANSFTHSRRSASPKSTPYIDTVSFAGVEYFYFIDIVGDIDSSAGEGPYSGQVVLWYQDEPTANPFSFTKVYDEARDVIARIDADISSRSDFDPEIDKVDLADNAVDSNSVAADALTASKTAADVWLEMKNYVWANMDTLSFPADSSDFIQYLRRTIADGVWDEDTTGHYSVGKYGYETLQGLRALPDSIFAKIDSLLVSLGYDSVSTQAKLGAFGSSQSSSTPLTLQQWLTNSVGINGTNDLHSKVDNLSLSGGGTEAETLVVVSVDDSTLIQGARTTIRTIEQSTVKVDGLSTDVNGRLIVELDADSFFVAVTANNYTQALDTLLVEAGGGTDTIWMASFDPGNPATPELCRVYGWVYDISGQPLSAVTVKVEIPAEFQPVKYDGVIITPFRKTAETDVSGYWQIDLLPNSILSDPESRYFFTVEYPSGVVFKAKVEVPNQASWQLQ
jgi:hypothetical protein